MLKTIIKQIEIYLGKFSLLTVELDREYNNQAASIINSEINSNTVRDDYVGKWASEVDSMKTKDLENYITIYTAINSKIDKLLNYLENEIKKETLVYRRTDDKLDNTKEVTEPPS